MTNPLRRLGYRIVDRRYPAPSPTPTPSNESRIAPPPSSARDAAPNQNQNSGHSPHRANRSKS